MQLNAGQINSKSHLHSWMSKQKSAMTELLKKEVLVRILRPLSVLMPSPDSFQPSWLSLPAKASILYSSTRVRVVAGTVQLRFSLSKTASPTRCQYALICTPLKQGLQDTHGRAWYYFVNIEYVWMFIVWLCMFDDNQVWMCSDVYIMYGYV